MSACFSTARVESSVVTAKDFTLSKSLEFYLTFVCQMRILRRAVVDLILYMLKNFTTLELCEDGLLTPAGF